MHYAPHRYVTQQGNVDGRQWWWNTRTQVAWVIVAPSAVPPPRPRDSEEPALSPSSGALLWKGVGVHNCLPCLRTRGGQAWGLCTTGLGLGCKKLMLMLWLSVNGIDGAITSVSKHCVKGLSSQRRNPTRKYDGYFLLSVLSILPLCLRGPSSCNK